MTSDATTFTDFGVEATLADALASKGIVTPFPIQELTLPLALDGADLIGQARTGTGKTLAFGLPLLQRIDPSVEKTQALVIVPTRELCLQVAEDLTIGKALGVSSIAIYGGVGYEEQIAALTGGVNVVIGTPGRTLDHLGRGNLDLSNVSVVVLDEADEMLDMGFLPDVERLLQGVPEDRQTLLFSATMPAAIVKLARRFMSQPTFMRAESEEPDTSPTVDQHFFLVHRMDKPRVLARILQSDERGGAFVFTRTKNMADRLVRELDDLKVRAIAVHGDLRQSTREKNLDQFRAGKADVLVATEVAARGLDVDNVTHVFNYDCPDDEKMYLHRIGRTARAGGSGMAVTFAEFNEVDRLNVIRKAVGADGEITEVFSTSDLLTERFDLPEETPWDHMARGTGRSGGGGSSRSGGGGSSRSGNGGKDRRRSSSDGRNQSRRSSDGSRPATRRDRPADGASAPKEASSRPSSKSTSGGGARTRTRTRTRSRSRGDADTATSTGSDNSTSSRDSRGGGADQPKGGARTRARRSRGGNDGGGRTSSSKGSGSTDAEASGSKGRRDSKGSKGGGGSRGSGSSRTSGSKGSGSSGSGSGGSRGSQQTGDRGGNGNRSDRGGSSGHQESRAPERTTSRGDDARGDGTPRPRRRVAVDHLP